MIHPFIGNANKTVFYVSLWAVFSLLLSLVESSLIAQSMWVLLLDGFIHGALFGALGILLYTVMRYGKFAMLPVYQRHINITALAILFIGSWIGIGYALMYILLGNQIATEFQPLMPIRTLIGVLLYLILSQRIRVVHLQSKEDIDKKEKTEEVQIETTNQATQVEIIERIGVKTGSKIHMILVPDIVFLQADGDYVQIFTTQGKYLKEQTMKYFEEHLPNNQFVRVHRSIIVNVEMISRIELYEKQSQQLTLKNGQQIKTSPAGYKALRAVLKL
jgi:DNA-binding LytR/AlgR family response regulator